MIGINGSKRTLSPHQQAVLDVYKSSNVIVDASPGSGKCLGKGTPVLMYSGAIKPVEMVIAGDLLMGPDSKPRKVLSTNRGIGPLYRITPVKGDPWVCNDVHVMTLVHSITDEVFDIQLDKYLKLPSYRREKSKLFRVGVDFAQQQAPLKIPPYFLGLWIGDGHTDTSAITSADPEIVSEIYAAAKHFGLKVRELKAHGCKTYFLTNQRNDLPHGSNALREYLKGCGLKGKKCIPVEYLVSDRRSRLELLAGIIDTDGYYGNGYFEVSTILPKLAQQYAFLARSLGFAAYVKKKRTVISSRGYEGIAYRVNVSGNCDEVPCRLPRKKAAKRRQVKSVLRTGFTVSRVGMGVYFGFQLSSLDGSPCDGRFLLGDFTVTHNTTLLKAVAHDCQAPTLFVAHTKRAATEVATLLPEWAKSRTMHSVGLALWHRLVPGAEFREDKSAALCKYVCDGNNSLRMRWRSWGAVHRLLTWARTLGIVPSGTPGMTGLIADSDESWSTAYEAAEIDSALRPEDLFTLTRDALKLSIKTGRQVDHDALYLATLTDDLRGMLPKPKYILVDEAQDLEPLQRRLIERIVNGGARLVAVGDERQCQPAGTMITMSDGTSKPIENVVAGDRVVTYDRRGGYFAGRSDNPRQSNRVMEMGSRNYVGPLLTISAEGMDRETRCTPDHKWVVKWTDRSSKICVVYMMRKGDRFRVGWCQLFADADGHLHLGVRARIENADEAWILKAFESRTEASVYESVVSCRYGMPVITFEPVHGAKHLTREAINSFFDQIRDTPQLSNAIKCLADHGRNIQFPIWRDAALDGRARQGRTTLFEMEACNFIDGLMQVPCYTGEKEATWAVARVRSRMFMGTVYSMNVEGPHTYVANGIVTHNCIFSWRGADRDAMEKLRASAGAVRLTLPVSYRLPTEVIEQVFLYTCWTIEEAPDAQPGKIVHGSLNLATLPAGALILCRRRAPLARQAALALRRGRKVRMIGAADGRALAAVLRDAGKGETPLQIAATVVMRDLQQRARLHKITGHKEAAAAAQDRADTIAALAGALISKNAWATVADMVSMLGEMYVDELSGDALNFSTIHRAKGAESRYVVIIGLDKIDGDQANELRYVALTRSQHALHIADVAMESEREEKRERKTTSSSAPPPRIETPYEVLGLRYGADEAAIKSAFRRLARELHPDTGGATADAGRFAAVVRAKDALLS